MAHRVDGKTGEGARLAARHVLVDLWGAQGLNDADRVARALRDAAAAAGATVIGLELHRFGGGGGVSGVVLLAESHMSVHTWPEAGFAAIDAFLCGAADPDAAVAALTEAFAPERVSTSEHERGRLSRALRFHEEIHPGWGQFLDARAVLHRERTNFQDLSILDTERFGRVLVLDGAVQATERDHRFYHEMLAHVPLVAHGRARRMLIVGGGDGGCLREALRHESLSVVLVEIDEAVIRASRRFLPGLSDGAFDDPRAEIVVADAAEWMRREGERFDVIVVDSTDPVGPGEALFSGAFYAACRARLAPGGVLTTQSGVPFVQPEVLRGCSERLSALFADAAFYAVPVPSYSGGAMALGWASDDPSLRRTDRETLAARFAAAGFDTRYYTPDMHLASFALPPYMKGLMAG